MPGKKLCQRGAWGPESSSPPRNNGGVLALACNVAVLVCLAGAGAGVAATGQASEPPSPLAPCMRTSRASANALRLSSSRHNAYRLMTAFLSPMTGRRHPTITWMRPGIGRLHAAMQQTAARSSGRLPTMPARPPADLDLRPLPLHDRDLLLRLMAGPATGDD